MSVSHKAALPFISSVYARPIQNESHPWIRQQRQSSTDKLTYKSFFATPCLSVCPSRPPSVPHSHQAVGQRHTGAHPARTINGINNSHTRGIIHLIDVSNRHQMVADRREQLVGVWSMQREGVQHRGQVRGAVFAPTRRQQMPHPHQQAIKHRVVFEVCVAHGLDGRSAVGQPEVVHSPPHAAREGRHQPIVTPAPLGKDPIQMGQVWFECLGDELLRPPGQRHPHGPVCHALTHTPLSNHCECGWVCNPPVWPMCLPTCGCPYVVDGHEHVGPLLAVVPPLLATRRQASSCHRHRWCTGGISGTQTEHQLFHPALRRRCIGSHLA
mmetsp:Transcript_14778/g.42483  ORF Transcript_14778/g.42483 Transcript_14778/m.42483 type:complete len:326 (-) Transcript_14778:134-1111(-)